MSRFWSPLVHKLQPYVPGEQPKLANLVKLNTNENPYGPSPKVFEAIQHSTNDDLRLYPDPTSIELRQVIADYHHVDIEQVFVGNGSDEVLAHTFQSLLKHDAPLLFPDISYSFYPVYCGLYAISYQTIPLSDAFEIDVNDYQQTANGGIIFPNPNAPTGRQLPLTAIESLLKNNTESVVVIDEAYIDFGGESAVSLIDSYPNLLVIQTLSKSRSLANLRIGFAIGHRDLIDGLTRIKDSFNSYPLDSLAMKAAIASFQDENYFSDICAKVIADREWLIGQLATLGFKVIPSKANFVFATQPNYDAAKLAYSLRENGVIVRHFSATRIDQYLRITVGTESQNQRLIEVLAAVLN